MKTKKNLYSPWRSYLWSSFWSLLVVVDIGAAVLVIWAISQDKISLSQTLMQTWGNVQQRFSVTDTFRGGDPVTFESVTVRPSVVNCSHAQCLESLNTLIKPRKQWREATTKAELATILRVEELLTRRGDHAGSVWIEPPEKNSKVVKTRYWFETEVTGPFSGMLVEPVDSSEDRLPLMLALHGHYESGRWFYTQRFQSQLAELGMRVFYLDFQAMDLDEDEAIMMKKLIHSGYTMIGVRLVQAVTALDYFLEQKNVSINSVFTIGHSGGGEIAIYLGILDERVKHVVTDNQPYSFKRMAESYSFHDEFIPDYYQIQAQNLEPLITELDLSVQPYGYKDERPVLNWLQDRLPKSNGSSP